MYTLLILLVLNEILQKQFELCKKYTLFLSLLLVSGIFNQKFQLKRL